VGKRRVWDKITTKKRRGRADLENGAGKVRERGSEKKKKPKNGRREKWETKATYKPDQHLNTRADEGGWPHKKKP